MPVSKNDTGSIHGRIHTRGLNLQWRLQSSLSDQQCNNSWKTMCPNSTQVLIKSQKLEEAFCGKVVLKVTKATGYRKQSTGLASHSLQISCIQMVKIHSAEPEMSSFLRPGAYITHNATSLEAYQIECSSLWSHQRLDITSEHRQQSTPVDTL